jgi:hypothetical protein
MTQENKPALAGDINIHLSAGVKQAVQIDVQTLRSGIAYKAAKDKRDAALKAIPRTKGGRIREKDWPLAEEAAKAFHAEAHEHWKIVNTWRSEAAVATYKKYAENLFIAFIDFAFDKYDFSATDLYRKFHAARCAFNFMEGTRFAQVEVKIGTKEYSVFLHPSDEREQKIEGFKFHGYRDGKPHICWADIEARTAYRNFTDIETKTPFVPRVKGSSFDCDHNDAHDLAAILSVAAKAADVVADFNTHCLGADFDFRTHQEEVINAAIGFRVFGWNHPDFTEPELPGANA